MSSREAGATRLPLAFKLLPTGEEAKVHPQRAIGPNDIIGKMPRPEQRYVPDWAKRERVSDLSWIQENLGIFWPAAQRSYAEQGRGALVVDTTSRPTGEGNPFFYLTEAGIEKLKDADALRMVKGYEPSWELVAMLLKREQRVSTYRIGIPSAPKDRTTLTN